MTNWVVAIPVWGDEFTDKFLKWSLPAIKQALGKLEDGDSARFIVHTNKEDKLRSAFEPYPVQFHPIPGSGNAHEKLGDINRQSLQLSNVGEVVAFINSDMVPSIEVFSASSARFKEGKKMVLVMGTRVLEDSGFCVPPIGETSRGLLKWAWEHRHPWISGCIWGAGTSRSPTVIYFRVSDGVVLHAFHLHPFAVVKEKDALTFQGVTIDRDLQDQFPLDQVHVVTSADEMAFAELSPASKSMGDIPHTIDKLYVAQFARNVATPAHKWTFAQRIEIIGPATDLADVQTASEILNEIETFIPAAAGVPPPTAAAGNWLSKERREQLMRQHGEALLKARTFHVVIPAWGDRHVEVTTKYTIPALMVAASRAPVGVRFTVYTDQGDVFREVLKGSSVDIRRVNLEINPHEMLNIAHKQAITQAPVGESIVLLDGDTIPSRELFEYALEVFPNKKVIATSALRTIITEFPPPVGATARELLGWGWRNRHPIAEACVWSRSKSSFPNVLFFEEGENVVMHTFHLHPFVMLKDRNPHFVGTIDDDLLTNYQKHEVQFVSNAELGFVEVSPPDFCQSYYAESNDKLTIEMVAHFARIMLPSHWRSFREQIRVCGVDELPYSLRITEDIQSLVRPSPHHPWPKEALDKMAARG
jgi:hypothetical protein